MYAVNKSMAPESIEVETFNLRWLSWHCLFNKLETSQDNITGSTQKM